MKNDPFLKAGLDHPCKQTCSGWQQGRERGINETEDKIKLLENKLQRAKVIFQAIDDIDHSFDRKQNGLYQAGVMVRKFLKEIEGME